MRKILQLFALFILIFSLFGLLSKTSISVSAKVMPASSSKSMVLDLGQSTPSSLSATLLVPNGGEYWVKGTQHVVSWEQNQPTAKAGLYLYTRNGSLDTYVGAITYDATHNQGINYYNWQIPLGWPYSIPPDGNNIIMEVILRDDAGNILARDKSDNPFTLVSPPSPTPTPTITPTPTVIPSPTPTPKTITLNIVSSSDDAYQTADINKAMYVNTEDIKLGWYMSRAGFRFVSPEIANLKNKTIQSAVLKMTSSQNNSIPLKLMIFAQNSDNCNPFTTTQNDLGGRVATVNKTLWALSSSWVINGRYNTPDIKSSIEEVVKRPGFVGTSLCVIVENNGSGNYTERTVAAEDSEVRLGANLKITYY